MWSTAGNWTPSGVPTSSDDVCITANGTYTVAIDGGVSANSVTVGGTSGTATLRVLGSAAGNAELSIAAASKTTAHGTLLLDSTNGNYAVLNGAGVFINGGKLQVVEGAGGGIRYLRAPITNSATGTVSITSDDVVQDSGTADTNSGTWTDSSAAVVVLYGNSSFTQSAGTLTNNGSFTVQSGNTTFTQSGGSESGNAVVVNAGILTDSAGTGGFTLEGSTDLTGAIPFGPTVTVLGSAAGNAQTNFVSTTVTNNGTLNLDSTNGDYSLVQGSALTNNGTLSLLQDAGGTRYLRVPITNTASGTVSVAASDSRQDAGTADTNNGTWTLADGGFLALSGGSSITTGSTGTLGFTVHAPSAVSQISGGVVTLGGRLKVTTIGNPALSTVFTPVTSSTVSGSFASLEFGPNAYTVGQTASTVTLTTGTPFVMTAKHLNLVQETPVKVTVATVSDPTPASSYTVNINWGDTTSSAGTFTANGTGGTAKGAHAYALPGSYTVTTTIHASDGTTITKTATATVSAAPLPTVTAVTPDPLGRAASTTLVLTGTGFTANSAVAFSATGITVSSTTWVNPTELKVKVKTVGSTTLGAGNVSVTTPGGTGTCTGCLTIDAAPKVTSIAPNPVHGQTKTVTVTGSGYQAGLTLTTTIPGATLGAPTGVTATSFTVQVTVPGATAPGTYKLSITNPDHGKVTANITVS